MAEVAEVTLRDEGGKETISKKKKGRRVVKRLSVLGAELLDQVLQWSELSPVDEVELLQNTQHLCYIKLFMIHSSAGDVVI